MVLPDPPVEHPKPLPLRHVASHAGVWPQTTIERIKESISILDLFPDARPSGSGGRWYITRCPWHDDRTPSLRLDTAYNIAFCWVGCLGDRGADVIGVFAKLYGLDTRQAIREQARKI